MIIKHLRKALIVFLLAISTASLSAKDLYFERPFALNPVNEGIQLSFGAALAGSAYICKNVLHINTPEYDPSKLNKNDIADLDMLFARPYSKPLHIVGTVGMVLGMATPCILGILPNSEWLTIGTMYAETLLITQGLKEWIKIAVYRPRPYMYFDGYPQKKVDDGDWSCSFPSGPSTLSFMGSALTTMVFCQYFPDSKWKYAVAGSTFGLAALTGGLRMASGNHFFTDVLAGACLGTACGFAVPYMHTQSFYNKFKKNDNLDIAINPTGFVVSFAF